MKAATNSVDESLIVCVCGNSMADHKCPSSQGYQKFGPKIAQCPECNAKVHQNIDMGTARLECLWRQWSQATGQWAVKHGKSVRYSTPFPTTANVASFGQWMATGSTAKVSVDALRAESLDAQKTHTASSAKRAEERAAAAPVMPMQTESVPSTTSQMAEVAEVVNDPSLEGQDMTESASVPTEQELWDKHLEDMADAMTANDNGEPTNADMVQVGQDDYSQF